MRPLTKIRWMMRPVARCCRGKRPMRLVAAERENNEDNKRILRTL